MTDGRDEMQRRANEEMLKWRGDPKAAEIKRLEEALEDIYRTTTDLDTARKAHDAVWPKEKSDDE